VGKAVDSSWSELHMMSEFGFSVVETTGFIITKLYEFFLSRYNGNARIHFVH
jgi:hypothetical protein